MTTLRDIVKHLQTIAPRDFTIKGLEGRVEIGPQTESEQTRTTIGRVLVATYPSARAVTKASQDKANLLITYRPLFPYLLDRLCGLDLLRVRLLTKNYISTYLIGSAWASANGGLTDALVDTLVLKSIREFRTAGDNSDAVPLGRVCEPPGVLNHSALVNSLSEKMGADSVLFTGNLDDDVKSVLVIAGSLVDVPEIVEAVGQDISTVVTGELSSETRMIAAEEGLSAIELGPFRTEELGMKRLRDHLALEFSELKIDFIESSPLNRTLRSYTHDMA